MIWKEGTDITSMVMEFVNRRGTKTNDSIGSQGGTSIGSMITAETSDYISWRMKNLVTIQDPLQDWAVKKGLIDINRSLDEDRSLDEFVTIREVVEMLKKMEEKYMKSQKLLIC